MSPLFENSENDLPLPGRRAASEADTHPREMSDPEPEREVTLNTGIVLALFFALALLCAVFFGFGYSMGRKSVPQASVAETNTSSTQDDAVVTSTPKPSPGSPATTPVPSYVGPASSSTESPKSAVVKGTPASTDDTVPTAMDAAPHGRPVQDASSVTPAAPVLRTTPPVPAAAAANPSATPAALYVQVSAVSHQEDANVLLGALRRRGYTVFTRSDPNDSLIHVQLGPFATRKDADAMRQRLSGDGYNAILK